MSIDILAVSESPVKNSNTDRLIQEIIRASGLNSEFIKLINAISCLMIGKACLPDDLEKKDSGKNG